MPTDLSINNPPISGSYNGVFYAMYAQGGYTIEQGLPTIRLAPQTPIVRYDITNALQVKFDVRTFNKKLGLLKDASNIAIMDTSYNYIINRFPNDTITLNASEFVSGTTKEQVISLGTYSTLYSDFNQYVNTYFGYAGGFASLFASVSQYEYNQGVFDASAFIYIINGKSLDASGAYVNNLTGSITLYNINNMLSYAVDGNVFANRDPSNGTTASDPNDRSNYGVGDGFLAGDLIYIPQGTTITVKLAIESENYNPLNNNNSNQISSNITLYGNSNYTISTTSTLTNIQRVLTAPLVIKLDNLSTS